MPSADGATGYPLETGVESLGGRRWPESGPSHIPNWVYTDPAIFALEQERIFAGAGWLYVCLEAEIANPGDFKRSRLGTREVVAVRDPSGEVTSSSTVAPIAVPSSAAPPAARRRNSSAPTIN